MHLMVLLMGPLPNKLPNKFVYIQCTAVRSAVLFSCCSLLEPASVLRPFVPRGPGGPWAGGAHSVSRHHITHLCRNRVSFCLLVTYSCVA